MIQFRQLEAFRLLMAAGTTIGAARRMHITQPAISRLIADLESAVGFRLFNRTKSRMEPTTAGLRFYKAVEENFLGLERLTQAARTIRNEAPQGLSIACLPVLATTLLPAVLKAFFKHHPQVPIAVKTCTSAEMMLHLQELQVDMALSLAFAPMAGISVEPILEVQGVCALPVGHRLCKKKSISPADLDGENVIGWMPYGIRNYENEFTSLASPQIAPRYVVTTSSSHTRYAMVANGLGVSLAEPFGAKLWRAQGVVTRPYTGDLKKEYVLAYPSGAIRSEMVQDFREAVFKVVKEYDFG